MSGDQLGFAIVGIGAARERLGCAYAETFLVIETG